MNDDKRAELTAEIERWSGYGELLRQSESDLKGALGTRGLDPSPVETLLLECSQVTRRLTTSVMDSLAAIAATLEDRENGEEHHTTENSGRQRARGEGGEGESSSSSKG